MNPGAVQVKNISHSYIFDKIDLFLLLPRKLVLRFTQIITCYGTVNYYKCHRIQAAPTQGQIFKRFADVYGLLWNFCRVTHTTQHLLNDFGTWQFIFFAQVLHSRNILSSCRRLEFYLKKKNKKITMKENRSSHLGEKKMPPKLNSSAFSGRRKPPYWYKSIQNMLQMSAISAKLANWEAQSTAGWSRRLPLTRILRPQIPGSVSMINFTYWKFTVCGTTEA